MKLLQHLRKKENLALAVILLIAFLLRIYRLGYESFWLDELHTANETNPALSLSQLFHYLWMSDQHPPLFFLLERLVFTVFGRSEVSARMLPLLAGVAGVYAIYLLGKEMLNKELGLIAAAFTCVNAFHLYYSREARNYTIAFLFAALSLLFLIRFIRSLQKRDMWYFILCAVLLLYTHYFGMFVVCAEFCIAVVFWFFAEDRGLYFRRFALSGVVIVAGFAAWLPHVLFMSGLTTFWITSTSQDFIFTFFDEYFGPSDLLKPVLAVLLIYYVINVFRADSQHLRNPASHPLTMSFVVFSLGIVVTYTVPYIRSLLVVPMMLDRYTIVVLPIYLTAAAYGLQLITGKLVKGVVFGVFIGWSLIYIVLANKTYTQVHKTQFREMTAYMANDPRESGYPVVNDRVMWQEGYYLDKFKFRGPRLKGPRAAVVDSMIHGASAKYSADRFWLFNAHVPGDPADYLDARTKAAFDSNFVLEKEQRFFDAWAQLYRSRKSRDKGLSLDDFPPAAIADVGEKVVAVWGAPVISNGIAIPPGNYTIRLVIRGTPAADSFPHVVVSVNNKKVGAFYATADFQGKDLPFQQMNDDSVRVTIELDNDFSNPKTGEDRNAFFKRILFLRN